MLVDRRLDFPALLFQRRMPRPSTDNASERVAANYDRVTPERRTDLDLSASPFPSGLLSTRDGLLPGQMAAAPPPGRAGGAARIVGGPVTRV